MRIAVVSLILVSLTAASCDDADPVGPGDETGPARLAFVVPNARAELYVQSQDGSGRTRIHFAGITDEIPGNSPHVPNPTDANILAMGPLKWSPDGSRLAVVVTSAFDQSQIVVMDRDGGNMRAASPNTQIIMSDLEWSADGRYLAYGMATRGHASGIEIFMTDLQTNAVTQLTRDHDLGMVGLELRWAPNSRSLLYSRISGSVGAPVDNRLSELVRLSVPDGAETQVAAGLVGVVNGISRNGDVVYLNRWKSVTEHGAHVSDVVATNVFTDAERVLYTTPELLYFELSAGESTLLLVTDEDGEPLEFSTTFSLLPAAGGARTKLADIPAGVFQLAAFIPGE